MNAVPADLPRMFRPEPKLSAVPVQPTARERESVEEPAAPRTWSFIDRRSGERHEVTCLPGCIVPHEREIARGSVADDVWCMTQDPSDLWLPVSTGGQDAVEVRLLSANLRQDHFSSSLAKRVPHAVVEILEDSFIDALDPDGLATVILGLEEQLKQMRGLHAQLVELREQGRVQL